MTITHPYMQMICSNCRKPIGTIFEPCPHCGYQHPLTEAGKKWQAKLRNQCPKCKSQLENPKGNVKVCRRCGTVVYKQR